MKIAVLISGYLRSIKENYNNLKQYLLNDNDTDIYIHITKSDDPKYMNSTIKLDELYKLLNPKHIIVSNNYNLDNNIVINNLLNQNYKYYLLNENRKQVEKSENIKYDVVVKIRPDVYLQSPFCMDVISNNIYIPSDSKIDNTKLAMITDNYICDIIAYGKPEMMDQYFNFYHELLPLIEKYGYVNETLLYHYLQNAVIEYTFVEIEYIVILSLCNTIAITGDSGSGKTIISNIIKKMFNNSFILECDRYHKWERNNENWNKITHLNPEANYITKMTTDVFNLKLGKNIYQVDYDHKTGTFTDNELIESSENIVVCGLHSLYIPDNIINIKIYVDTDDNLRIPWKIKRDISKRGYTVDQIVYQINNRKSDFNTYIYPQREKSDIIIHYYTDTVFDINTFSVENPIKFCLRIGIREHIDLTKIISLLQISSLKKEESFNFLYFPNDICIENIITTILSNI
jgi:uridine kinase